MEAPSAQELSLEEGKPTGNNRKFFPSKIVDLIREVLIKIIEVVGPPAKKLIAFLKQKLFFWLQEFRRATPKQKIWKLRGAIAFLVSLFLIFSFGHLI